MLQQMITEQSVVGGKSGANALEMAGAAQQVPVKWIAALRRLIRQLHLTILNHKTTEQSDE